MKFQLDSSKPSNLPQHCFAIDSPRNALFPATQPGGGLKCQLNVTKCQDKQRLRDYLFRINFILPSSA
jgi:hypothetical protein